MVRLLDEIEWQDPIFPAVADPAWESEVKRRTGSVGELDRRLVPSSWLREAYAAVRGYSFVQIPQRMALIGAMVTAQENSCRYCYGGFRSYLKMMGHSEGFIDRIERDAHIAEMDEKERAFIAFCRKLARSKPRPAKAEKNELLRLGYTDLAVNEMAFSIAMGCFTNRLGVLTACPPDLAFEKFANGVMGRLVGMAIRLKNAAAARKGPHLQPSAAPGAATGPFGPVVAALEGLPAAPLLRSALDSALASPVLSREVKILLFAVVARTLDCKHCEVQSQKLLLDGGLDAAEIEKSLATLGSSRLESKESRLLAWVRDTVHYQTGPIQAQTRALAREIGEPAALEAIGVASLANATVRLAMLLE